MRPWYSCLLRCEFQERDNSCVHLAHHVQLCLPELGAGQFMDDSLAASVELPASVDVVCVHGSLPCGLARAACFGRRCLSIDLAFPLLAVCPGLCRSPKKRSFRVLRYGPLTSSSLHLRCSGIRLCLCISLSPPAPQKRSFQVLRYGPMMSSSSTPPLQRRSPLRGDFNVGCPWK